MEKVILHHLGMGDHLICNGLIRKILQEDSLILHYPLKFHNYDNVSVMLGDLSDRIRFIPVKDDGEMIKYASNFSETNKIRVGVFKSDWGSLSGTFCEKFYKQLGIPYFERWNLFHFSEKFSVPIKNNTKESCFVHQDLSRNLKIKNNYLPDSFYSPNHSLGSKSQHTIFDYVQLLNEVEEIHCIDSSFACLIDHLPSLKAKKKFIHRYVRKNNENPIYKNNWRIIYE